MDIIHCTESEWLDSWLMLHSSDSALSFLGYVQPQCFPSVEARRSLRHVYEHGRCLGYVEE